MREARGNCSTPWASIESRVIGHHTGAAVALEMAASRPERVHAAVLSSCPWTDRNYREGHSGPGGIDCVDRAADGSHLTRLWEMRRPYYPEPGTALLDRFIRDALAYRVDPAEGHKACAPLRHGGESRFGDCAGFADRRRRRIPSRCLTLRRYVHT